MSDMRRREFITLLGGAAAWVFPAGAQTKRVRRIGVLMGLVANDPEAQSRGINLLAFSLRERSTEWLRFPFLNQTNSFAHIRQAAQYILQSTTFVSSCRDGERRERMSPTTSVDDTLIAAHLASGILAATFLNLF